MRKLFNFGMILSSVSFFSMLLASVDLIGATSFDKPFLLIGISSYAGFLFVCVISRLHFRQFSWSSEKLYKQCMREKEARLKAERTIEAVKRICANQLGFTIKTVDRKVKELEDQNWKP